MNIATTIQPAEKIGPDLLTQTIVSKLGNPETSSDFDFHGAVDDVLRDVGLSTSDNGGKLSFYGRDPIIPSPHRFGTMAAIGLAAKAVAVARCGASAQAWARISTWMSARRSGASPASSI
jgi:hypothetical protein